MSESGVWAFRTGSQWAWRKRRAWWAAELLRVGELACGRCRMPIRPGDVWHLDHVDVDGNDSTDDAVTRPSHAACNLLHGRLKQMRMGVDKSRGRRPVMVEPPAPVAEVESGEPGGLGADEARSVGWLADCSSIGAWPRLMSSIRPDACGSLGVEAIEAIERWAGRPLWPWQRLVLLRALEVDAAGGLVWRVVVVSVPRQMGKSTIVGEAAEWRLRSGGHFGEPQDVLHVARDVAASTQVQRPHRIRAEQDSRFKVRTAGGRLEIEHLDDGGRWLIRSVGSVYSYSASMGIVDEAWDVDAAVVDDGIGPVLLQRDQAQLWLVSTANAQATSLMLSRRAAAMTELDEPSRMLWIEWSAPPDADESDPAVWQRAVPHWSEHVAEFYRDKYETALQTRTADPAAVDPVVGFAQQYLNRWPPTMEPVRKGKPLLDLARWKACAVDHPGTLSAQLVVGLDEHWEGGVSVVVVSATDAGFYLETELYDTRAEAIERVGELRRDHPGMVVLASAVLVDDAKKAKLRPRPVGGPELTAGVAVLRTVVGEHRLSYHDCDELTVQLEWARAVVDGLGQLHLQLDREHRLDTLRAALWAVGRIAKPRPQPSIF